MKLSQFSFPHSNEPKKMVAIALSILMGFLLVAELIWGFDSTNNLRSGVKPVNPKRVNANITAKSALFTNPLFGHFVPVNLSDADIKQSTLDVEVVGILFAAKEEESQVIIRAAAGEEKTYIIGDSLPGGAMIQRISQNAVVVLHNGHLESLSLPKNELLFQRPAKALVEE